MKKLFTSVLMAIAAMTIQAKDYSGNLNVIVPDMSLNVNQEASVSVNNQSNGKYELIIKDFVFGGVPVGTIDVKDVEGVTTGDLTKLTFKGSTTIQPNSSGEGDLQYTDVDITLDAITSENGLGANIVINAMGMDITVSFTPAGAYIPNSDFENFHEAEFSGTTTQEADHWHSFTSAYTTSGLFNTARRQKQSFESTEVREGAAGTKSLLIKSAVPLPNVPANGTVTTGRIQAGAAKATDTANCAFLDITNTAKDDKGDPFYVLFTSKPDAIEFYTRFKQGQDNLSNKYASIRAVITDGTRYQDPEDKAKTYKNVVAVASNKNIEGTDAWQKVTADFDYASYVSNEATPKAILVTISTNSEPGVASKDANNPDCIYIDDLSLIYNANLTSLKLKGTEIFEAGKTEYTANVAGSISLDDIQVESDGQGAYISKSLEETEGGSKATITITSNDLKKQNVYTINIKGASTGIKNAQAVTLPAGVQAIYNLAGQQVGSMTSGNVYIVKTTDGKTKKVIKK